MAKSLIVSNNPKVHAIRKAPIQVGEHLTNGRGMVCEVLQLTPNRRVKYRIRASRTHCHPVGKEGEVSLFAFLVWAQHPLARAEKYVAPSADTYEDIQDEEIEALLNDMDDLEEALTPEPMSKPSAVERTAPEAILNPVQPPPDIKEPATPVKEEMKPEPKAMAEPVKVVKKKPTPVTHRAMEEAESIIKERQAMTPIVTPPVVAKPRYVLKLSKPVMGVKVEPVKVEPVKEDPTSEPVKAVKPKPAGQRPVCAWPASLVDLKVEKVKPDTSRNGLHTFFVNSQGEVVKKKPEDCIDRVRAHTRAEATEIYQQRING